MKKALLILAVAVALPAAGPALSADLPVKAPPRIETGGSVWFAADYLLWSAKGDRLPALVTTSPAGTPLSGAGVLSFPGTSVLFGDGDVNDRWRSGGRLRAGYWFDPARSVGIEGSFFMLANASTGFFAASNGTPILAQPFTNAVSGFPDALIAAFPGLVSGSIAVNDTSRLFGAGAVVRKELCANCFGGRVDGLVGYRFLRLTDSLGIASTHLIGADLAVVNDQFDTANNFHGLDLGLTGDVVRGPWTFTWLAKVAFGATLSETRISGATTITPSGGAPVTTTGGFLTAPSNVGSFDASRVSVVPELSAELSYRIGANTRIFAGYNFIYWSGVARPGGAIDTVVNPIPGLGPARPLPTSGTSDYWAQGVNFGLAFNF